MKFPDYYFSKVFFYAQLWFLQPEFFDVRNLFYHVEDLILSLYFHANDIPYYHICYFLVYEAANVGKV